MLQSYNSTADTDSHGSIIPALWPRRPSPSPRLVGSVTSTSEGSARQQTQQADCEASDVVGGGAALSDISAK